MTVSPGWSVPGPAAGTIDSAWSAVSSLQTLQQFDPEPFGVLFFLYTAPGDSPWNHQYAKWIIIVCGWMGSGADHAPQVLDPIISHSH